MVKTKQQVLQILISDIKKKKPTASKPRIKECFPERKKHMGEDLVKSIYCPRVCAPRDSHFLAEVMNTHRYSSKYTYKTVQKGFCFFLKEMLKLKELLEAE